MTAPERIWVNAFYGNYDNLCVVRTKADADTSLPEYVRADLAPTWRSIDSAPKDGTPVDLWGINHLRHKRSGERLTNVAWGRLTDWLGNERDDWKTGRGEDFQPTHWMPLPQPPEDTK